MSSLRKSNVMKAVKASNYMKTRAKWGHSINTILKEKNPNQLPFKHTDISKYLRKPEDDDDDDDDHHHIHVQLKKQKPIPSSRQARSKKNNSTTTTSKHNNNKNITSTKKLKSSLQQSTRNAAMMIEFQPGTKVVYGSYINFKSSQGWYLRIDRKNGLGTCVEGLNNATTFKILNQDGDKNFGPVSFGDSVRLMIQDQEFISEEGDVFEFALGSRMAIDLNNITRTRMDQATPQVLPSRVPYFGGKKSAKARWTLVHPTKGYRRKCKKVAVTHLGNVSLETDWLRLASIGRAEDNNVSVALHEPQGALERQEVKLKTKEGKLRKEQQQQHEERSNQNNNNYSNNHTTMKKKKTVSGLTAAANMRWNVHLAMLATSKDGGETTAENKANERTLLRAQEQVFASRKRREIRGDDFVMKIDNSMKIAYAKAENQIATIKLKDRLYKDISNASLFSEEISTQPKRRNSKVALLTMEDGDDDDRTSEHSSITQHETTLNTHPFPLKTLTKLEKANALAEAARLQALVKSSVWAEISVQQRLQEKEEAEELQRAVIVLQRATRNWIRKRWKVRLERQDVEVFSALDQEQNNNNTSSSDNTFLTTSVVIGDENYNPHTATFTKEHLQSIDKYKKQRPSSAAPTAGITYDKNNDRRKYPSSATPKRTVITQDFVDDNNLEEEKYSDKRQVYYDNQSTSIKNIKQRRKQRPQTANARVVPRRNAFGSSSMSYNNKLSKQYRMKRAQSAKRVAQTNEKVMATIESVKKLQDQFSMSNTPLNDELDQAILRDNRREKKLLLERGYAMPRTLGRSYNNNNSNNNNTIRPKSAIGSPTMYSIDDFTKRPVSAAAGLFHQDHSNFINKQRNNNQSSSRMKKRTPLRRSKSASRYIRPRSNRSSSKKKYKRRGTSAGKPSKYLRNMHILPLDYPSNNLLKRRQKMQQKNKHSISGPNLLLGGNSSSTRLPKSQSAINIKPRFSLKGLKMTEQDKTLANTVNLMENVSEKASASTRKWNY